MGYMNGSNVALRERFAKLESDIDRFKDTFGTLLTSLVSLKHEALCDNRGDLTKSISEVTKNRSEAKNGKTSLRSSNCPSASSSSLDELFVETDFDSGDLESSVRRAEGSTLLEGLPTASTTVVGELWGMHQDSSKRRSLEEVSTKMKKQSTLITSMSQPLNSADSNPGL